MSRSFSIIEGQVINYAGDLYRIVERIDSRVLCKKVEDNSNTSSNPEEIEVQFNLALKLATEYEENEESTKIELTDKEDILFLNEAIKFYLRNTYLYDFTSRGCDIIKVANLVNEFEEVVKKIEEVEG